MASNDAQMNTASSATKDIKGAIKMGKDTAKAAKTVSKVASQAASGNYVGAAVSLLKDPQTLKKILVIILFPVMLLILFLYALPTIIYEAVVAYFDGIVDEWNNYTYAEGHDALWGGIWATIRAGGTIIGDAASAVGRAAAHAWNWVVSLFSSEPANKAENGTSIDVPTDEDMHVAQIESAERSVLLRKIKVCMDKVNAREKGIVRTLNNDRGKMVSAVKNYLSSTYGLPSDKIIVNVSIASEELSEDAAIEMLALYTAQTGASLEDIKDADLMKWMGWYNSLDSDYWIFWQKEVKYSVLDGTVTGAVPIWNGTFIPQYLLEQKKQEIAEFGTTITDFNKYGCPAVDLCLYIDSPSLSILTYEETPIEEDTGETDENGDAIYETVIYYTSNLNISLRARNASALTSVAGLWAGSYDDPQGFSIMAQSSGLTFANDGDFVWPLPGNNNITSPYGMRVHPISGEYKMHTGVDIGATKGTPILAAAAGRVTFASYNGSYGNFVIIDHGGGIATRYAHMDAFNVSVGTEVNEGDIIGLVGNTGASTGAHLHFEVKVNGEFVNPTSYTFKSVID